MFFIELPARKGALCRPDWHACIASTYGQWWAAVSVMCNDSADLIRLREHYHCVYRIVTEHQHIEKANDVINE